MKIPYSPPDYYLVDELLTTEQKFIRSAVRDWVDRRVKPIIDDAAHEAKFPTHLIMEMGALGAFGPFIPVEYGGSGLDHTSYGLIMTELERGDSGIRSWHLQTSLVMYLFIPSDLKNA
jgi:glutaryl-CoA dehydrogenase